MKVADAGEHGETVTLRQTLPDDVSPDRYAAALQLLLGADSVYVQTNGLFLIAHTVLVAVVASSFSPGESKPGFCAVAIVGGLLSVVWLLAAGRACWWLKFRRSQAKAYEPSQWNLLKGDVERFARALPVALRDTPKIPRAFRLVSVYDAVLFLPVVFILAYGAAVVASGPWFPKAVERVGSMPDQRVEPTGATSSASRVEPCAGESSASR